MTPRISKLILAAVLASSLPVAASADDCDHDRRGPPAAYPAPAHPGPTPAWRDGSWRQASWRDRELREVRAELRALDQERAVFHARHAGHPGKVRKFERSYAERRAQLERRWYELQAVAWR